MVLYVEDTQDTASEFIYPRELSVLTWTNFLLSTVVGRGYQFDYTVNSVIVRALTNGIALNVVVTFYVDTSAQESNETFTRTLNPCVAPIPRVGLFFWDTIQVTIVDSDNKDSYSEDNLIFIRVDVQFLFISFSKDSYRVNSPAREVQPQLYRL